MSRKPSETKQSLYVRLPAYLVAAIDDAADRGLVSRSAIIRSAVAKALDPRPPHTVNVVGITR